MFSGKLLIDLVSHIPFDQNAYAMEVFEDTELPWQTEQTRYPTTPSGDVVKISRDLISRYEN